MKLSPHTRDRLISLTLGLPSWAVLGLAAWLVPATQGHGTHRQLGLGECTILHLTGYPCPMCGMTTTFAHMAHLEPFTAVQTQPFGVVLFLLTLFVGVTAVVELIRPNARWMSLLAWLERYEGRIAIGLLLGLFGGWVYKVGEMGLMPF